MSRRNAFDAVMVFATFLFGALAFSGTTPCQAAPPLVEPAEIGMDALGLAHVDQVVENALAAGRMPGCVVCIGRHGKIAFLKAYGNKRLPTEQDSRTLPATTDTVYDLASLTKPVATATSVLILAEQGKIDLDAAVATYLPEFRTPKKEAVTVRQLLLHTGGFIADNSLNDYRNGTEDAVKNLLALNPVTEPGAAFRYSDVSFQLLGILVERVSGQSLDVFSRTHIFEPLGMNETTFCPEGTLAERAAPTQDRKPGEVHDPRAFQMGGVAGHAGLFSTAGDLAVFATRLLDSEDTTDTPDRVRLLKPETLHRMREPHVTSGGYRGLGWDMASVYSGNRGKTMSPRAFGHGGFTGTALWLDPGFDLFVIFLSNRVHPDGKGSVNALAGEIATIAVDAVVDLPDNASGTLDAARREVADFLRKRPQDSGSVAVWTGLDVLRQNDFSVLRGKRVGLITNHTGCDRDGTPVAVVLKNAPGVELVALFSPEHGFTGQLDQSEVPDERDGTTGLKVFSLYGKQRKPTPQMLDGIDILVFDIQDIGTRFYTYIATMLGAMEAAAMKGIPFVVLDRPNPVGGTAVEGPLPDPGRECFVGCFRIPIRHGMTVGELALMMNVRRRLGLELHILPCSGWTRGMDYAATGLPWINPSPNMRSTTAATLYPGVGLLEFTNLSVGRGTATPFELVGAPWIDEEDFVAALREKADSAGLEGVRFETVRFTPDASKFQNTSCGGVRFVLEDAEKLDATRLGLILATTLRKRYRDQWETGNLDTLLLRRDVRDRILNGDSAAEIESGWANELGEFRKVRERFLLYGFP